jgi:hypothetical protein
MRITEIKALTAREPFRQFVILLQSGHEIVISKASELLFPPQQPELVIVFTEDETWLFEAGAVAALSERK